MILLTIHMTPGLTRDLGQAAFGSPLNGLQSSIKIRIRPSNLPAEPRPHSRCHA